MIDKGNISQEPFIEILKILEEAETANLVDWNAMNIASVDQMNQPSSRMVLLKKISDDGLMFYTNYNSRKGSEIELNPKVAVNFWWRELKKPKRRYPKSKGMKVLYAVFDGNDEKMDYITSRKKNICSRIL